MLKVIELNDNNWDKIVKSFNNYDVYYLSGYTKAFKAHGDGEPYLFYYQNEELRAINVVMKNDVADCEYLKDKVERNKYYDLVTPYGYGGWIIEGNGDLDLMFNEYFSWCNDNNIVSEFIRFHPLVVDPKTISKYYEIVDLAKTVAIVTNSEEEIWNNFSSKNRNVIRKAIKNNVEIKYGLNQDLINEFKTIYEKTMDKDNADPYYYFKDEFYQSLLNDFKDNTKIFYALYDEKIIAASIILEAGDKLSYHLSGSLKEYGSLAASNLLLCKVATYGAENGFKTFHLGGGVGSKEDSLYAFKKAFFKGEDHQYSIGKKIINQEAYEELVMLRNNTFKKEGFFPKYKS